MKLSDKLLKDYPYHLTPIPGSSGTSMSSKTPGRDLEDRWSLDIVSVVGSSWNFHRSFWRMIPIIWHNVQIHQEPPYPPRLQEETWRTGGVLTGFLMLDLEAASEGWSLTSDTNSRFIRNLHVFQHSMKLLGGQGESWWVSDVGCRWKSYVCMHAKHYTINMHFLDMKEGSSF